MTPKNKYNVGELIGRKFGRLTIIGEAVSRRKWATFITAKCDCGTIKDYCLTDVAKGHTKSCGCLHKKVWKGVITKHGLIKHPLYNSWMGMKQRCYDPAAIQYKNYGGRGITICDEWRDSFQNFYDWAIKNGWRKGLQIDRHLNNDGNYEPNNCRWATRKEQCRNKSTNVFLEFYGKKMCLVDWATELEIGVRQLSKRYSKGWPVEKILTTPHQDIRNNNRTRFISFKGETKCLTDWSEQTGIAISTIRHRLDKYGWSIEKSLTTAVIR